MITDDDAEKAVDRLRDGSVADAQARANRIYMEQFTKTVKAQLMQEFNDGGTSAVAQERNALADPRFMQQLGALQQSVFEDEKARFEREAAIATLDAWRTFSSNQRAARP